MKNKRCPTCGQHIVKNLDKNVESSASSIGNVREVLKFYRLNRSIFMRKIAQTLTRSASSLIEKSVLSKPLKSRRKRSLIKLPPLEQTVVKLKHLHSLNFRKNKIPYLDSSPTCSDNEGFTHFTGDSLTFEFFNTISPHSTGDYFAKFDVFLCGVNSQQRSLHFWEHLITFVSLVNDKKRQNRVLEIWVPELGNCCDQLLLVVEGCITNYVSSANRQPRSSTCTPLEPKRMKKTLRDSKNQIPHSKRNTLHEFTQSDLQQNGNGCLVKVDQTKMALIGAKRLRLEEGCFKGTVNFDINGSNDENIPYTNEKINLSIDSHFGRRQKSRVGLSISGDCETESGKVNSSEENQDLIRTPSELPTHANNKSKIRLRGTRLIGKWINKQTSTNDEEADNNYTQVTKFFKPIFSSKGIYLNTCIINETNMSEDFQNPSYQMIQDINVESSKRASRDSCSILQMEVSNEHGYGSNIYEMNLIPGLVKKTTSNDPLPFFNIDSNKNIKNRSSLPPTKTSKQNNKTNKPVRYFISDSNPGGQDSTLSLADLRGFTSTWKTPVKCLICSRRFSHIWHLAFHLLTNYPSLNFKFYIDAKNGLSDCSTSIDTERNEQNLSFIIRFSTFYVANKLQKEPILIFRNMARFMRLLFLELSNRDVDSLTTISSISSNVDDVIVSVPVNCGTTFKGVLPFKESKYVEMPSMGLCSVDCDRGWIRDSYKQRFNQFTDLLTKEKRFFCYWNDFIGKPINRELAQYQMPVLMKRFIFEYGDRLKSRGLFSNFLHHCAVLRDFNFISDEEMRNALIYTLLFQKR